MRHKSRHKQLYQHYRLLCTSKTIKNVWYVKKHQPEDNSIGSCLNLMIESSLPLKKFPNQKSKSTVVIQTSSKCKLEDTIQEESHTKRKSQSSIQSDPKVDHTCLKCQRIFQTTQHKDCQNKDCSSLGCNYCISCVCGISIPDQPVVSKDMKAIGKKNIDKSHVNNDIRNEMIGVLDDSVTKLAGVSCNPVTSADSHVANINISSNYVTSKKSHVKTLNHVTSCSRPVPMKVYMCSSCNDIFKSNCEATFHWLVNHMITKKYACVKCKMYISRTQLAAEHEMMELHCSHCGKDLPSSRDVIAHWTKKEIAGSMKSKRKTNFMSLETDRLCGKISSHNLFCRVCKKTYETECHPNWHNSKDVFNVHWCVSCLELLRGQPGHTQHHETDHLHCAYCDSHFTSLEELLQHIKLRTAPAISSYSHPMSAGNTATYTPGSLLSSLPMSAGNKTIDSPDTLLSSTPVTANNTTVTATAALPYSRPVAAYNTTVTATAALPSSRPVAAYNTTVTATAALPSSRPVVAKFTKDCQIVKIVTGALPCSVPVTVDETKVTATGAIEVKDALHCSIPVAPDSSGHLVVAKDTLIDVKSIQSLGKAMMDAGSALPSKLLLLAGKTTINAMGGLPVSLPVSAGNPTVNAVDALPSNLPTSASNTTVTAAGVLPSNLPVSAENTAVNATGTLPSSLLAAANSTKVTVRGAQCSSLHVKGGKSAKSAIGTLPSRDGVDGKTTEVPVRGAQISNTVNVAGPLPSSLHGSAGGTKVNATWASPSGLQGSSEASKSRSSKEQHVSYAKLTLHCLYSLKPLRAHILYSELSLFHTLWFRSLRTFFQDVFVNLGRIVSSTKQLRAELDPAFEADEEQDPHDFLIKIIEKCKLGDFFQTDLTTKYECPSWECRHRWERTHTGNSFTLPRPESPNTTMMKLMDYQKSDSILCPKCGSTGVLKQTLPTLVRKYLILRLTPFYTLDNTYYPLQIIGYDTRHIVLGRYCFETRAVIKLAYKFNTIEYSAFVRKKREYAGWKEHMSDGSVFNRKTVGQDIKGVYLVFLKPTDLLSSIWNWNQEAQVKQK